jgi:hypothetical protein
MAVYNYTFKVNKAHKLEVVHPFSGNVVVSLDGKVVRDTKDHTMDYEFDVEGKPCKLEIAYEVQDYGIAKMQSWVHRFFVDGESIQAEK